MIIGVQLYQMKITLDLKGKPAGKFEVWTILKIWNLITLKGMEMNTTSISEKLSCTLNGSQALKSMFAWER